MNPVPQIFDRRLLDLHRARSSADAVSHEFLLEDLCARALERLSEIRREFSCVLDLGAHHGLLGKALRSSRVVQMERSGALVHQAHGLRVQADEELLPFAPQSFDAVISLGALQWVNDLPGTLAQVRRVLKPDGLFLAIVPGAQTLFELRESLMHADLATHGGASPRVAPFLEVRDAGNLLQRAGFALPVIDSDMLSVRYQDIAALMRDLRGMGQTNALVAQQKTLTRRATLVAAEAYYHAHYGGEDGRIPATFEWVSMLGWAPDVSQPKALTRGSGKVNLRDVLH